MTKAVMKTKKTVNINLTNNKLRIFKVNRDFRKKYLSSGNDDIDYNLKNRRDILIELKRVSLEDYEG